MKKVVGVILVLGLMMSINSCQEESYNDQSSNVIEPIITKVNVLDNIESIINPIDVKEYALNPDDIDDESVNIQLLEIAIAAREYFSDNSFNEILMKRASISSNRCFNLNELASVSTLKSANPEYSKLISTIENTDLKHTSKNPLKSGFVEEYVPAIHIVNLETADMSKKPIICPGFEVNSELKGMKDYEDYIVGWFYDEKGSLVEILLNEKMALKTKHPIYVIDNAEEEAISREKSAFQNDSFKVLKSATSDDDIYTYEYKINHRYERSGDSEFCITAVLINELGQSGYIIGGSSNSYSKIAEVSKRKIGDPLYHWELICSNEIEPLYDNYIFWNTYERDWFNSNKNLGVATKKGVTISLSGNRKYTSEWYGIDPNALENSPLDLTTVVYNNQKTYSNTKGSLQFKLYP